MKRAHITFGLAVFLAVTAHAATYYVDPSGNDSNPGTSASPWATIQNFGNYAQAGDTLIVRAGTYVGAVFGWDPPNQGQYSQIFGTSGNPITIEADPSAPEWSVIINQHNNKTHVGIDLEPGCDYVTIKGFVVDGAGGIANYPDKGSGLKATGIHDTILNCWVKNIDYGFGITSNGADNILIQNNIIENTGWHSNANYGHGIYVAGLTNGAIVMGNLIRNNGYTGLQFNGDPDIIVSAMVVDNQILDNGGQGINADGLRDSYLFNNLIVGYQTFGITLFQIDASGPSTNNDIANNTIVAANGGGGAAIRINSASTGNTVFNNILLGGGDITYRIAADSLSGFVSDHNAVSALFQSDDNGSNQSLADWQAGGRDLESIQATGAQLFLNSGSTPYQLSDTSPAIDKGLTIFNGRPTSGTDILLATRPVGAGYDLGAYEHGGIPGSAGGNPPPIPPPSSGGGNPPPSSGGSPSNEVNVFSPRSGGTMRLNCTDGVYKIFSAKGAVVRDVTCDGSTIQWDGRNKEGRIVANGLYGVRKAGVKTRKVMVLER